MLFSKITVGKLLHVNVYRGKGDGGKDRREREGREKSEAEESQPFMRVLCPW